MRPPTNIQTSQNSPQAPAPSLFPVGITQSILVKRLLTPLLHWLNFDS